MTVVVFAGPTIAASEGQQHLAAEFRAPVAQGDVCRAVRERARAIGIVDGYFDRMPAVWHKEILWAMSEGIPVYGSASMGALRAAELADFGMVGVGEVFEAFRSGALEDDDEVAVAHAAEESGFRTLSVAMVNIRATIASAHAGGVLAESTAFALTVIAKAMFYAERAYPAIIARGLEQGLPTRELADWRAWLKDGAVDVKHADAVAMLDRMRREVDGERPQRARFHFESTNAWQAAMAESGKEAPVAESPEESLEDVLQEELQLFAPLAAVRAIRKERLLLGKEPTSRAEDDAVKWYFARLGRTIPPDLEAFAKAMGMPDARAFRRAVWREHELVRSEGRSPDGA